MIIVNIRKPLYGNFCYIRATVVDRAIRLGEKMQITVPNGTAIVDPAKWKESAKIMHKVFKFEDAPMCLYGNHVPVPLPKAVAVVRGEVVEVSPSQLKLF